MLWRRSFINAGLGALGGLFLGAAEGTIQNKRLPPNTPTEKRIRNFGRNLNQGSTAGVISAIVTEYLTDKIPDHDH